MALELFQLKKHFVAPDGSAVPIIDIDSLSISDGEQLALMGSSGSGKTTLLHLIAGILTPESGSIVFKLRPVPPRAGSATLDYAGPAIGETNVEIGRLSEADRDVFRGRHIGYIFQTHHLLAGFTALENVLLGMSFTGRRPDREWARRLLDRVGLSQRLDYKPEKLSVGQQQRVAVARAMANRPSLVLADEPTGALDAANAQQVLELIRSLCEEVNASLLLVSHDPQIAGQFSRVLRLSDINRASAGATVPAGSVAAGAAKAR